jgi:hypothetical protein
MQLCKAPCPGSLALQAHVVIDYSPTSRIAYALCSGDVHGREVDRQRRFD